MQLFAEGKCGPVNRRETCQEEVWGGLSFDMYNVFTNVMHGDFRLAAALDSGRGKKKQQKNRKSFERQRHFQASVGKIWHIKPPSLSLLILYRATM